jgi:hypothetical protein
MAHANLVCSPLLLVFFEIAAILEEATSYGGARGSWMRLHNSGRDGHLLLGCPSLSHSVQGGWMHGGSGAVGSFFFHLPLSVAGGLVSGGVGGMVGVSMGICISMPSIWGGRDG